MPKVSAHCSVAVLPGSLVKEEYIEAEQNTRKHRKAERDSSCIILLTLKCIPFSYKNALLGQLVSLFLDLQLRKLQEK